MIKKIIFKIFLGSSIIISSIGIYTFPSLSQGPTKPPNTVDVATTSEKSKIIKENISTPRGVRVKDIAQFRGARYNQLNGIGLVTGLNGTGDSPATLFTVKELVNMLERFGLPNLGNPKVKNVAGVIVSANLPPFYKEGQRIDVTVNSMGDAKSLQGGFLLQTPLRAADGRIYAVAQGPISIGGFGFETKDGKAIAQKGTTLNAGRIPNGAIIEKEVPVTILDENYHMYIDLNNPDFTTAAELADKINKKLLGNAKALDANTVQVFVTSTYRDNLVDLIARIENIEITPQNNAAKVVLDERTGTIIIGQNVSIGPVSVAHGGVEVKIEAVTSISQPPPFSSGTTTEFTNYNIEIEQKPGETLVLVKGSTVGNLVKSLNALGVPPMDLITILQMIKAAGALNAHLEIQ